MFIYLIDCLDIVRSAPSQDVGYACTRCLQKDILKANMSLYA